MDVAVDEDAAGELGVSNKEAGGVVLVAGLGAEDGRSSNVTVLDACGGVAVACVEAS